MTNFTPTYQYGGDIAAYFSQQAPGTDPATPIAASPTFLASGGDATAGFVPLGISNIPGISAESDMDRVFGIGDYRRLQYNPTGFKPSVSFNQRLRGLDVLQMGIRDENGHLGFYSLLAGNSDFTRMAFGAKVESMDLTLPLEGPLTAQLMLQAVYAGRGAAGVVPAMDFGDLEPSVYYGYHGAITFNGDTYTDYFKSVRVSIKHEIERMPTKRVTLSLPGGPVKCLVSRYLKEKSQVTNVSFELYNALPLGDVAKICRDHPTVALTYTDDCHPGRSFGITLPNLTFGTDKMSESDATSILSFGAEADARDFILTETQAS